MIMLPKPSNRNRDQPVHAVIRELKVTRVLEAEVRANGYELIHSDPEH